MKGQRLQEIIDFCETLKKEIPDYKTRDQLTTHEMYLIYEKSIGKAETDMEYLFTHLACRHLIEKRKFTGTFKIQGKEFDSRLIGLKDDLKKLLGEI